MCISVCVAVLLSIVYVLDKQSNWFRNKAPALFLQVPARTSSWFYQCLPLQALRGFLWPVLAALPSESGLFFGSRNPSLPFSKSSGSNSTPSPILKMHGPQERHFHKVPYTVPLWLSWATIQNEPETPDFCRLQLVQSSLRVLCTPCTNPINICGVSGLLTR